MLIKSIGEYASQKLPLSGTKCHCLSGSTRHHPCTANGYQHHNPAHHVLFALPAGAGWLITCEQGSTPHVFPREVLYSVGRQTERWPLLASWSMPVIKPTATGALCPDSIVMPIDYRRARCQYPDQSTEGFDAIASPMTFWTWAPFATRRLSSRHAAS